MCVLGTQTFSTCPKCRVHTERSLAVLRICVDVGAAADQQPNHMRMTLAAGVVQRRPSVWVAALDVR